MKREAYIGQDPAAAAAEVVRAEAATVAALWRSMCATDAATAGAEPLDPPAVVHAFAHALDAPGGLGVDGDPLEPVADALAERGTSVEVMVRQLGLLREALHRVVVERMPATTVVESQHELNALLDSLVAACAARLSQRLEQAAFVDPLTGLLNRRAMERDLAREMAVATRHDRSVSVVMVDLDGLKEINDHEGHVAGDRTLAGLATALQDALRAGDSAYRIGGDEFLVLLPETPAENVASLIQRIVSAGAPSFSWGAATAPDDGGDGAGLLDLADRRLFERRRAVRSQGGPTGRNVAGLRRRRERRGTAGPLMAAAFMVGAILGGAGLASATTGVLPGPAQSIAHTVLAKVGVDVPKVSTEVAAEAGDDARGQSQPGDGGRPAPRDRDGAGRDCTPGDRGCPAPGAADGRQPGDPAARGDQRGAPPDAAVSSSERRVAVTMRRTEQRTVSGGGGSATSSTVKPQPGPSEQKPGQAGTQAGEGSDRSGDRSPAAGTNTPPPTGRPEDPKDNGKDDRSSRQPGGTQSKTSETSRPAGGSSGSGETPTGTTTTSTTTTTTTTTTTLPPPTPPAPPASIPEP